MFVFQIEHGVGIFTVIMNKIKCDCRFAILVRLSVFILFHYCGGIGLLSRHNGFAFNISVFAQMIIYMAVAIHNEFIVRLPLYDSIALEFLWHRINKASFQTNGDIIS